MPRPVLVLAAAFCCACGGSSSPTAPPPAPVPAGSATTPAAPATGTAVGPAGGTVTSSDGRAVLTVPAGALSADVALSVSPGFAAPDAFAASPVYVVGPAGTRFALPVDLAIAAAPNEGPPAVDPTEVVLHVLEGAGWRTVGSPTAAGSYRLRWTGPAAPCPGAEHREFDFWLGAWNFVVGGSVVAPNDITRDAGGCLILERYAGGSGASVSYIGQDGAWYQHYVSAAPPVRMRGGLEGRRMVMYGQVAPGTRYAWDPVNADRVGFIVEQSTDGGVTWAAVAPNEYRRR
jgi:hypothetical protein